MRRQRRAKHQSISQSSMGSATLPTISWRTAWFCQTPRPISAKLASADVEKGRISFGGNCASCHNAEPQGGAKIGPNLWGVVGRDKASLSDKSYSEALMAWQGVWTY